MNPSIQNLQNPKSNGVVLSSGDASQAGKKSDALRKPHGLFTFAALLAGLLFLLYSAPSARAQAVPPGCVGSAIGISLFTAAPDVHIGDTILYSVSVFNGLPGNPTSCDASNIVASLTTPDGAVHPITLRRTYLSHGQSDLYNNVASYVVRAQDIRSDGTVRATAEVTAAILQGDTPSAGGANQGVNTEVSQPCINLAVQCVGGVGENGAITFTGTVTNCGNNTLVGVTVTNFVNGGQFQVTFINTLARGQIASFNGSWIPLNPCSPSTATFVAQGVDQFTTFPRTVTSSADTTCQNTLTPGIKVTKVCPTQPVSPGALLTFSGSVSNTGNVTLTNIVVVNSQPAANTPVFTRPTLAPGEVANFSGSYTAPANCSVADTLTATAASRCGTPVTSTASATCPILTTPQIGVTAACPTTPVLPGGSLVYSGTVRNLGDTILNDIVVVSDRPAPNTTVFTAGSLAPGASANFTSSLTAPASGCDVTTTFSARGKDACTPNMVTNTVSATCPINTAPAIAVTLACPVAPVATGGLITYTGTVRNSGNVTLNNVTVVNNQASPSTVFTVASLAPGVSANFTASFTTPADACSVSSSVTASGSGACTEGRVTASASATCPLGTAPGIMVTQVCPVSPVTPGGLLTYSGTVRNSGNITLTNVVVVNNLSGATPVFTAATLAPGAVANFTGSYSAPANTCSTASSSTATGRSICGVAVTHTASATCPILTAPQIVVTAVCPTAPIVPGSVLTYSGTVRNAGNITLTNVVVVSDRPAANTTVFTAASLAPGASAPYTASFTVPATDCSVATTVAATGKDLCTGATTANSANITCTVATAPAIAVTLACPATPVATGGLITYTGTVRNSGNVTLNNVTVINNQASPSTVFSVPSLAAGASANFTASFTVPADGCSVSSSVTARGSDACTATVVTDTKSATCPLGTTPSIVVTQVCPVSPVTPGGLLTYSGTVRNSGNITLTNVVVVNSLSGATPVFTTATLAPGAVANFTGSYTVPANTCSTASSSTATGQSICGVAVTHTASATCPILTAPQIAVTAACPATPIVPGSVLTYTGTVRNTGNITLTNVVVVSDRPAANTTVFTAASLAPGASAPYTASFTVPPTDCSVTTTVAATGKDLCTGATTANSANITCTVATAPAIAVTLACPAVPVATGALITYTGTVRNSGNIALNNVTVVNNQASPSTVLTLASLAVGASANFTASFTTPADACSVSSTVTARGSDACTETIVTASASATCPLLTAPRITVTQNCPVEPMSPGGTVTYSGSVRNAGNITLSNIVVTSGGSGSSLSNTVDTIWVDDAVPSGAVLTFWPAGGDSWTWVTSNPAPFSGTRAHQSQVYPGTHQHVFKYANTPLPINAGDTLFAYVYLDPANVPSTVMLEWHDGSTFEHRAYWGANNITELGTDGTDSRRYTGPLPAVGQWVRLEVPASSVGLEGRSVGGMAFALHDGRATWDAAGKATRTSTPPPITGTVVFTAATLAPGAVADFTVSYTVPANSGCSFTSTLAASGADTCTGSRVTANVTTVCPLVTNPGITVTQTCPPNLVSPGGILTYTGIVRNTGNITLTNVIVVNNEPAPNTVIFTAAMLAPGAQASFTGSYQVPWNCCVSSSTVRATGQDICTGVTVADTDTATCTALTVPRIVVTKACPPEAVEPGDLLRYSGTVSNAGTITLINVTIENTQPSTGSPVLGPINLAPGESVRYYASYVVSPDFCGTDTVTARGLDACTYAAVVNSVTTSCPITTTPRIFVTKNCPPEPTPHLGLLIFTGTVSNPGNVTLTNVYVVNNQPSNNTPVLGPITLAPGASVNFTGSYTTPKYCCDIVDTLTARGQGRCSGEQVTATATAICPLVNTPRIAVTKDCPAASVPVGGLWTFSGSVSNSGDTILTNVYVVSSAPSPNTPLLGPIELAPGETKRFSGSYTVTANSNPQLDTVTARGVNTCQGVPTSATANCFGSIDAPAITAVTLANGVATVSWAATPGTVYALQFKSGLRDSNWISIPGNVTAGGYVASKSDAVGSTTQRLYRVMIVQ